MPQDWNRRASLTLTTLCLLGCTGSEVPEMEESEIWSGWNYTWERLSHRVSLIRAVMEPDGIGSMGLVGGDWSTGSSAASDSGNYRLRYQEVRSNELAVVHGHTDLVVGPDESLSESVAVALEELERFENHIVILRGFSIDTDTEQLADYPLYDESTDTGYDPALGYCSRGFGFSVGQVDISDGNAFFDVEARLRWGPTGEDDPIDRSDMNEAIPHARTAVTVAWSLVGFDGSEIRSVLSGSVDYAHGGYSEQPPLMGSDLGLELNGTHGVTGIVSFDLGVEVTTDSEQGEYLRSFGVEVLEGPTDTAPFGVETEATNSSLIETAAIRFSPEIELAWIELSSETEVTHASLEGAHEVGFVTVDSDGVID